MDPSSRQAIDASLARVRAGDIEAYSVIVEAHQRALRTWVARWCPPGVEADEIAHRAFIAGFRSIHRFKDGVFLTWLCAIARNELLGELKRRRREPTGRGGAFDELADMEQVAAAHDLERVEPDDRRVIALGVCLKRLQGAAADLVDRRYRQGQAIADIAKALGTSIAAVKARLHWLRGRLHACISERLAAEEA